MKFGKDSIARTLSSIPEEYFVSFDKEIEAEIVEKGLTAPRVTLDHVESLVKTEQYYVFTDTTFTVCLLTLKNGFQVSGDSACASPENFDAEIGRKIARGNAVQKIWALEGYLLREKLFLMGSNLEDPASDSYEVGYIAGAAARAQDREPVVGSHNFMAGYEKGRTTPFSDEVVDE